MRRRPPAAKRLSAVLLTTALASLALVPTATADPGGPARAAGTVDLARYAGTWWQLAAVPKLFELQCAKNVKAVYGTTARGTVSVANSCTTWLGTRSRISGEALPLDSTHARLNVSFLPQEDGYRHGTEANYVVVGLGPAYEWAVVTDEDRSSGFVLSRTPRLDPARTADVLRAVREAGLDPRDFRATRQDGGDPDWRLAP
ncbi:lipocalin family protein [Streptomyces griseus]|uniref:lipocalin family protein n=1 Tax=Streptomyces griseus TaxID=1911 RepID=UPI00068AF842|nr:lipocalin family protein [Streptomyces griseus]